MVGTGQRFIRNFCKIFALGHSYLKDLFTIFPQLLHGKVKMFHRL